MVKQPRQPAPSPAQKSDSRAHRSYLVAEVCERLNMSRRTFFRLRAKGQLPMLEELHPRLGRLVRYRADLVDQHVAGRWSGRRFFGAARRSA